MLGLRLGLGFRVNIGQLTVSPLPTPILSALGDSTRVILGGGVTPVGEDSSRRQMRVGGVTGVTISVVGTAAVSIVSSQSDIAIYGNRERCVAKYCRVWLRRQSASLWR